MATTTNILALLKFFASKQKSAVIDYGEFCTYLRKYSEHHIEEQSSLVAYLQDTAGTLQPELDKLIATKQIAMSETSNGKLVINVIPYFIEIFADKYKEIEITPALPFPTIIDLPKLTPKSIVSVENASDIVHRLLDKQELHDKTLYGLLLPNDEPIIILPSNIPIKLLVESSLEKVQNLLRREGYHDYFLKKLTATNPGKELTAKNFFNKFVDRPDHSINVLSETMDDFYLWHQLCYFIKQDYKKLKDYTQEDLSTIQAILITEIAANYYKNKAMDQSKRDNAFKMLDAFLNKPPYYFSYDSITKFVDTKGHPLLGQYTEEELKDWLQDETTGGDARSLPNLLVFKMEDEKRYFIYKTKVLPLVARLCTDARDVVKENITEHWYKVLKNFGTLQEMHDQNAFEARLEMELKENSPVLYSLLTVSFLPLLSYEQFGDNDDPKITLFANGELISYSDILLINRQEILTDSKIKLPFWYTIPVISWIAKLIFAPPKRNREKKPMTNTQKYYAQEELNSKNDAEDNAAISKTSNLSKKLQLRDAAREAEKALVNESSTIERELTSYEQVWNKKLGASRDNLTEDVNVLIRDYMRKVLRTLTPSGFTLDRIQNLANSLVKTPAMMKIGETDALERYVQLYIIKLVKNLPTYTQIESQYK